MKEKILMVCNYFAPENTIGAIRTSRLAKYFCEAGYEVHFVTEKKKITIADETILSGLDDVKRFYLDNSKLCRKFCNLYSRITRRPKQKKMERLDNRERINPKTGNIEFYPFETAYPFWGSMDYLVGQLRQKDLARRIGKVFEADKYDYVITSYGDSMAFFSGKRIKRLNKEAVWIFDIRDSIYRYKFVPDLVKHIPLKYEKYIWKNADAIVGISDGICNRVPAGYSKKVFRITNGFEDDDISHHERFEADRMSFTYTGSMYGGLQNLSKFFEAVSELIEEGLVEKEKLVFVYAGNESAFRIYENQAGKSGLNENCLYVGKLTREKSVDLQKSSDVLLMASYDYKDNNGGVLTGKIFEYMGAKKPVIAIVTGDGIKSEVSSIIEKTNIGICFEESAGEADYEKLKKYIKIQYDHFVSREALDYAPVETEIGKYTYKNISNEYIKLLRDLHERRK